MKKNLLILLTVIFCIAPVFASAPELKFQNSDTETEVLNFDEKNKVICRDNVRLLNNTSTKLSFELFGKKNTDSEKVFLCSLSVKANDTQSASCKKDLDNFKYIYIICSNGNVSFSKITCEHNDMYFYIGSVSNVTEEPEITDFTKYQKVEKHEGSSKDSIFEGILQGCVKVFNKSTFVIEYKDKDTGIIKGKAQYTPTWVFSPTTYYFLFTFEVKEGRYRITFDNLEYDVGTLHVGRKDFGESEFNEMKSIFDDVIRSINESIKSERLDDDW